MIIEDLNNFQSRLIKKELGMEKNVSEKESHITSMIDKKSERFFESKKSRNLNAQENINIYVIVSIVFVVGFLIGIVCFERSINEIKIRNEILNYDFFYNEVEDKSIILADMMYKNIGIILFYWIVGISVVGAPLLLFVCLYKGMSLAVIISSVLLKHGLKTGYMLLIKNVFLQHFLSDIVIVFLTVSSIKVLYRILFQKYELKNELLRHSIAAVLGLLILFTTIGINCITILNNFT